MRSTHTPGRRPQRRGTGTAAYRWALRLAGFVFTVCLVNTAAQMLGLTYYMPLANKRALKIYYYQQTKVRPDILFIGTSKTNRAVRPEVVEAELSGALGRPVSAFCLGQPGVSAFANHHVLRDVTASNGHPALVVLEVTPVTLNANHGGIPEELRYYCSLSDLLRAAPSLRSGARAEGAAAGAFRGMASLTLLGWQGLFQRRAHRRQMQRIGLFRGGWYNPAIDAAAERLDLLSDAERARKKRHMRHHGRTIYMARHRIGGLPESAFHDVCRLARGSGMRLVAHSPPVTRTYLRSVYGRKRYREFLDYMADACAAKGITFIDMNGTGPVLTDADYRDFGHLNADGARKFSRFFARTVLLPELLDVRMTQGATPTTEQAAPPVSPAGA